VKSSPSSAVILNAEEHTRESIFIEETEAPDLPGWSKRATLIAIAAGFLIGTLVLGGIVLPRIRSPARVRSILVLPFANLSTAGDVGYYSDGLTEELIGTLSQVHDLAVVPRTTAFQFKGKPGDVREIGRQLEADAVLDGSVQRDSDRLRIHLSLTRVSDGQTIWSRTYDRTTADALATPEEIARGVLQAVFPKEDRLDIPAPGTRKALRRPFGPAESPCYSTIPCAFIGIALNPSPIGCGTIAITYTYSNYSHTSS
jgi:TolB-like protein